MPTLCQDLLYGLRMLRKSPGFIPLLVIVALVACLIPARRASRVDPMVALKYE